jgi:hypothetical protein
MPLPLGIFCPSTAINIVLVLLQTQPNPSAANFWIIVTSKFYHEHPYANRISLEEFSILLDIQNDYIIVLWNST